MAAVFHLKHKVKLENSVSGDINSPIEMVFNIGGPEPDVLGNKTLTVAKDGLVVFHDQTKGEVYSNRRPILSKDGKTLTFEK